MMLLHRSKSASVVLWVFVQSLLTIQTGCAPVVSPQTKTPSRVAGTDPTPSVFGNDTERRFDFGPVIGDPNRKLSHTFTLRNRTEERVGIVSVINGMACCGDVEPIRTTELLPGQALDVKVTVKPSRIGPLRHWVSVKTDRPEADVILLRTLADVRAPVRIEATDHGIPEVTPGRNVTMHFQLIECVPRNDEKHGGAELSIAVPGRPALVRWEGPPRERSLTDELKERVRPFTVRLTANDQSGADGTQLIVSDGREPKLTHQLRWNVVTLIHASPPLLTINGNEAATKTLVLNETDGRDFKVLGITSDLPGVTVTPRESSGARHVLDVAIDPKTIGDARRLGEIAITTDLAAQRSVKVPIVVARKTVMP